VVSRRGRFAERLERTRNPRHPPGTILATAKPLPVSTDRTRKDRTVSQQPLSTRSSPWPSTSPTTSSVSIRSTPGEPSPTFWALEMWMGPTDPRRLKIRQTSR
jgi:hypothetical protein